MKENIENNQQITPRSDERAQIEDLSLCDLSI
jgi:hypothetical protein